MNRWWARSSEIRPRRGPHTGRRILSLDVDGAGFASVGGRDRVVQRLQRAYPGLRPVLFWSPYEAAAWTIIGHRIRITQSAAIKQRMAEQLGIRVEVHGDLLHAFPPPRRLKRLRDFLGLFERKVNNCMPSRTPRSREGSTPITCARRSASRLLQSSSGSRGSGTFRPS